MATQARRRMRLLSRPYVTGAGPGKPARLTDTIKGSE
jgi:hypothetical protein